MLHQNQMNLYIHHAELFDDRRFIILCISHKQSEQLMHSLELQADKTFSRTKAREFEINSLNLVMKDIVILARVFIDNEDE
jgi:hypothetical protein